jgi:hypothetical protein
VPRHGGLERVRTVALALDGGPGDLEAVGLQGHDRQLEIPFGVDERPAGVLREAIALVVSVEVPHLGLGRRDVDQAEHEQNRQP